MGIHDRDWYRDEFRRKTAGSAASRPPPVQPTVAEFTTSEPLVRRIAVKRSTYLRWRRSLRTGVPTWMVVVFWVWVLVLCSALAKAILPLLR